MCLAFFLLPPHSPEPPARNSQDMAMTKSFSSPRERAEAAFGKTQSQALARDRTISEIDAVTQARDEKTSRLRAARIAKEAEERAANAQTDAKKTPAK
jgi:hypothetical protein